MVMVYRFDYDKNGCINFIGALIGVDAFIGVVSRNLRQFIMLLQNIRNDTEIRQLLS